VVADYLEDVEGGSYGVALLVEGDVEAQDARPVFGGSYLTHHSLPGDLAVLLVGPLDGVQQHSHGFVRRRTVGSKGAVLLLVGFPGGQRPQPLSDGLLPVLPTRLCQSD